MTPPPSNDYVNNNNNSNNSDVNAGAVIIFDWDDTILPSSYVDRSQCDNVGELPKHARSLFREIEICTERCLAAAACHGEVSMSCSIPPARGRPLHNATPSVPWSASHIVPRPSLVLTRFHPHPATQVIIITNSDEGWVKYSAERYLPNLIPVLKRYRIVSARTRYERFYPNQPLCWKAAAFAHEVNEHFVTVEESRRLLERECGHAGRGPTSSSSLPDGCPEDGSLHDLDMASTDVSSLDDSSLEGEGSICSSSSSPGAGGDGIVVVARHPPPVPNPRREIVSIGDSIEERTAVRIVSDQLDAVPKSVKFLTNPTPTQIIGQLAMMTHHMTYVCEHDADLDLEISTRQAEKCASGYLARRGGSVDVGGETASPSSTSILGRILGTTDESA
jgi:hypothetical protein